MIPRIFHYVWPSGGELKPKFKIYMDTFKALHPGWKFRIWYRENRSEYALSDLSSALQSIETGLSWIVVSDIMRHEILYRYGGIYVDTDTEALKNFDCFLDNESFGGLMYSPNGVGNGIIGTIPLNPLFKDIAEGAVKSLLQNGSLKAEAFPPDIVGAHFAGKMMMDRIRMKYPLEYFYPFKWDNIAKNTVNETDPLQRASVMKIKFPNSYSVHWWSGKDPDGWTSIRPTLPTCWTRKNP